LRDREGQEPSGLRPIHRHAKSEVTLWLSATVIPVIGPPGAFPGEPGSAPGGFSENTEDRDSIDPIEWRRLNVFLWG